MKFKAGTADIAVIGAGHAGIEAASAAARLGCDVILFTLSLDTIGNLPCNPSIGGTAKGHLVREIDALGGMMGRAADATMLQSRMLNRGKGPAVHSLRNQTDREGYKQFTKRYVENVPGLKLIQSEVTEINFGPDGEVCEVVTGFGAVYSVKAAIICTGTYQNAVVHVGEYTAESGPDGNGISRGLSDSLRARGIALRRFKTGTPARVKKSSIDFSAMTEQPGEDPVVPFSFSEQRELVNTVVCHSCYTNEQTHAVILANLDRSPLYGADKRIEGVGPRYCPSIEDKVMRFADKSRHQFFIEPMGANTEEMYLQGLSSSLPLEVQYMFYRTIAGLENVEIMRPAYAIEYDCIDPTLLAATLEFKDCPGLYGAGQFNGTSGYEEAAAQGLVAGINAARRVKGESEFSLERSGSYIGTLIDDLITKGCEDPYRMMTSRSEYRLFLRQDNADRRLTPIGHELGLVSDAAYEAFLQKQENIRREIERVKALTVHPSPELESLLVSVGTAATTSAVKFADLLRRPQLGYEVLGIVDPERPKLTAMEKECVEIEIKYEGYIKKQLEQIERASRLEQTLIPKEFDYSLVRGLRLEAVEKLTKHRPASVARASGVSGVSPADISVLLIYLAKERRSGRREND